MALIGSIAINMSVRTAQLVKGMKTAAGAVKDFGAKSIAPLARAGRVIGDIGSEIGKSFAFAGKGLAGPLARGGALFGEMARGAMNLGGGLAAASFKGLTAGLKAATFAGRSFASTFRTVQQVATKLAVVGGTGAFAFYKIARAASSLAEQTDRARVMFGGASGEITDQAKVMADAFGISESQFIKSASEIGGMFEKTFGEKQSAQIGAHFARLAIEAKSAFQVPTIEEAMVRMTSGLAGEAEAVRRWGVDLTEANLKVKAQAMGLKILGGELDQTQKKQVRMILMEEGLAKVQGNLAKTAGGAENAAMGLMGRIENLAATVGTAFLPVVGAALVNLQEGVMALSMLWSDWTRGVVNEQVGVVGAVGVTTGSVGYLQRGVIYVADAWQTVKGVFGVVQSYITSGIGKIIDVIGYMASALDAVADKLHLTKTGLGDVLKTYGEDLKRLSDQQFLAAGKTLNAPSAEGAVGDYFAKAQERIQSMRTEAMKPGVNPADFKPTTTTPAKVKEQKFASASVAGSQDAANAILRSRFGTGKGEKKPEVKAAADTARNTAEIVALMRRQVAGGREPIEIKGATTAQRFAGGFLAEYF